MLRNDPLSAEAAAADVPLVAPLHRCQKPQATRREQRFLYTLVRCWDCALATRTAGGRAVAWPAHLIARHAERNTRMW